MGSVGGNNDVLGRHGHGLCARNATRAVSFLRVLAPERGPQPEGKVVPASRL